jgi:hypothetical protein
MQRFAIFHEICCHHHFLLFTKKEFRNSFEEQLIKEFKPPTNKEFNKYKDKPSFYVTENEILDTLNSLN